MKKINVCSCAAAVVLNAAASSARHFSIVSSVVLVIQPLQILVSVIRTEHGVFFHLHNSGQSGWLTLWDPDDDDDDDDDDDAVEHHDDKVGL